MNIRSRTGFTLIEIVMVIALLGILAAFSMPKFQNMSQAAKIASAKSTLGSIRSALATYYDTSTTLWPWARFPRGDLPASMFPDGQTPLNNLTGRRGAQGMGGVLGSGTVTSPTYGFYYVQYDNSLDASGQDAAEATQNPNYGRAFAYSDGVEDTTQW